MTSLVVRAARRVTLGATLAVALACTAVVVLLLAPRATRPS